jgi:hypothetical protein
VVAIGGQIVESAKDVAVAADVTGPMLSSPARTQSVFIQCDSNRNTGTLTPSHYRNSVSH